MTSQIVGDVDCFTIDSFVHGHHVYQSQWTPYIGECLVIKGEPDNQPDDLNDLMIFKRFKIRQNINH